MNEIRMAHKFARPLLANIIVNQVVRASTLWLTTYRSTKPCFHDVIGARRSISISAMYNSDRDHDFDPSKRREFIKMEYEVRKLEGYAVPENLSEEDLNKLVAMDSTNQRRKYLQYLGDSEMRENSRKASKEIKKREHEERRISLRRKNAKNPHIIYALYQDSLFMRIRQQMMNKFYNRRLLWAAMFGQKIVVDLGYESHMNENEIRSLLKQMQDLYGSNKKSKCPFDLNFCNAEEGFQMTALKNAISSLGAGNSLTTVTEKSYLDLFPKEKLIYLTARSEEMMDTFDHDAVYIIGGVVNKAADLRLSLAKARKEGIKSVCLPFDKHVRWVCPASHSKNLKLDQVLNILLEVKQNGNNWLEAFVKHLPSENYRPINRKFMNIVRDRS